MRQAFVIPGAKFAGQTSVMCGAQALEACESRELDPCRRLHNIPNNYTSSMFLAMLAKEGFVGPLAAN